MIADLKKKPLKITLCPHHPRIKDRHEIGFLCPFNSHYWSHSFNQSIYCVSVRYASVVNGCDRMRPSITFSYDLRASNCSISVSLVFLSCFICAAASVTTSMWSQKLPINIFIFLISLQRPFYSRLISFV